MELAVRIAAGLQVRPEQVRAAVELLDGGNTIPFVARYRKEATDGLDEEQLRNCETELKRLRALEKRREAILANLQEQGKLTEELRRRLSEADSLTALEDLYQPFRPRRRTRAQAARERGLEPLAERILAQRRESLPRQEWLGRFVTGEVADEAEALSGAVDIVAEVISDHPAVRGDARHQAMRWARLRARKIGKAEDPKETYRTYYDFEQSVGRMRPHQTLAINRGEKEKVLRVSVEVDERDWRKAVASQFRLRRGSTWAEDLERGIVEAARRLLLPAVARDVRRALTQAAEDHAIGSFSTNLRSLLATPPLPGKIVMGLDPGFRTGCKLAVTDSTGSVLAVDTVFLYQKRQAREKLEQTCRRYQVDVIAIGNGTASRETEQLVAELDGLSYCIVDEAGASVYSASPLARQELPDLDVTLRGAVSIARRLQDPLAELVKIEPRSLGVGMYQHDVDQNRLTEALEGVVESVVNRVGVDLNTASAALLGYVSGVGPALASAIVSHRDCHGPFERRGNLKKVAGLGPRTFEQCAGFLRIRGGREALDATAIHPESYPVARAVLKQAALDPKAELKDRQAALGKLAPVERLAQELGAGVPTLVDILEQLVRPGRDPREDAPPPVLRQDVLSMEDLKPGMRLQGTVRNVVDFGAFIDIGVKQDGLLHRSQIPRGSQPGVGQVLEVEVLSLEPERGRISLGWS